MLFFSLSVVDTRFTTIAYVFDTLPSAEVTFSLKSFLPTFIESNSLTFPDSSSIASISLSLQISILAFACNAILVTLFATEKLLSEVIVGDFISTSPGVSIMLSKSAFLLGLPPPVREKTQINGSFSPFCTITLIIRLPSSFNNPLQFAFSSKRSLLT